MTGFVSSDPLDNLTNLYQRPIFIAANRVPTVNDVQNPGTLWQSAPLGPISITQGAGIWDLISGASSGVDFLTGGTGGNIAPVANNITLAGTTNQITTVGSAGTITFSVPSTFTSPGSVTATLGNITATAGNIVVSTSGDGLVLPVATGSGAASGAVVCNGRVGSVSFTSPSIAAGATSTLTVTNSAVTGSGTVVLYSLRGATTGSALSVQSQTNSAGSSAVVVTNGTGATTQTGTITLDFIVLN
jgi:hypothetical protein